MGKNVIVGSAKSKQKSTFILCCTFLVALITSCGKQSAIKLKYTSGICSILEDSKGNTWFGSYSEGVCLLHNGKLQYFTTENGLSNNQVRSIYEDKNGVIWFECGKGLSIYDGVRVVIYKKYDYNSVNKWKLNKGDIWFKGYEGEGYNKNEKYPGVYQYDGQKLSYRLFPVAYRPQDGFKYYISTSFVEGKNGITWFGAYGALVGYDGLDFLIFDNKRLGLTAETGLLHIRSILGDKSGNIWIGNNGMGVLRYDGKEMVDFTAQQKLKKKYTKSNSLEKVFSIGEDDAGSIWFGTVGSGVWRYDGTYVKNFTEKDGLESKHIWTIHKSKQGEMWFGGANPSGVYRFNGSSFERKY